jgi:hypothetical protein
VLSPITAQTPNLIASRPGVYTGHALMAQLGALLHRHRIMLFGEATHNQAPQYRALAELIRAHGDNLDWVGFEIETQFQPMLDRAIATGQPVDTMGGRIKSADTRAACSDVMRAIRAINHRRAHTGRLPIRVLALDKSSVGVSDFGAWFFARDAHMFGEIRDAGLLEKRGIFFGGAAHFLKAGMPVPKVVSQATGRVGHYTTVGELLQRHTKEKPVRIWVQPPLPKEAKRLEAAEFVADLRPLQQMPRGEALFKTKTPEMTKIIRNAGIPMSSATALDNNFDYLLKLEH